VDPAERTEILRRYARHARRFGATVAERGAADETGTDIAPPRQRTAWVAEDLTERELNVLQLVADGLVNREIGQQLYLSEETIKSHVRRLLAKLQARSRAQAVAVGMRNRLIA
jgi:DNA-binding NarL/FixJ family response regulator